MGNAGMMGNTWRCAILDDARYLTMGAILGRWAVLGDGQYLDDGQCCDDGQYLTAGSAGCWAMPHDEQHFHDGQCLAMEYLTMGNASR